MRLRWRNGNPKEPWCTLVFCIYCIYVRVDIKREREGDFLRIADCCWIHSCLSLESHCLDPRKAHTDPTSCRQCPCSNSNGGSSPYASVPGRWKTSIDIFATKNRCFVGLRPPIQAEASAWGCWKGKIEGSENQKDCMIQGFVNSNQLWYSKKTIYHVVSCDGIMNIWFLHFIVLEIVASKNVY